MKAVLASFLIFVLAGFPASAADAGKTIEGPVVAKVVKVRDGDTIEVEAQIWPQQTVLVAVRLRGIDAPELKARCDGERKAAELARDRLTTLVQGGTVELRQVSGDKYFGRVLAIVATADEPDLSRRLLGEGLVVPYAGQARRDWCTQALRLGPDDLARPG